MTTFGVISPKDVGGDTFWVNTTLLQQISPIGLAKILLGRAMDLILNFLEMAEDQLSQNVYFYLPPPPPLPRRTVFELWLFVLEGVTTT